MRKVVSLFMATILMIGVLAACGPKRDAEQVKDNNKGNTTENPWC